MVGLNDGLTTGLLDGLEEDAILGERLGDDVGFAVDEQGA